MPAVFIQKPLAPEEILQFKGEFPEYDFVLQPPDSWDEIEVLFGDQLSSEQLQEAHQLRWIHVPQAVATSLPLKQIEETRNLLITNTKDPDTHCFAEYALAIFLASAKNLLGQTNPIWSLRKKTLLQIGLGQVGTAICAKAEQFGIRTWGIVDSASFHPHCTKTFDPQRLHALLPAVDILSISIPRGAPCPIIFGRDELELMQPDSMILMIGSEGAIDEEALCQMAEKFRNVVWDRAEEIEHPHIFHTANIASEPTDSRRLEFFQFHYNFRRYVRNEFDGMKNLLH